MTSAANPSSHLVAIRSSANSANSVVMTLVGMSRLPSTRMFSFSATKEMPALASASRMATDLTQRAAEPGEFADDQAVAALEAVQQLVAPAAFLGSLPGGGRLDEVVDPEVVLAGVLEDGEALAAHVLLRGRDPQVGDGSHVLSTKRSVGYCTGRLANMERVVFHAAEVFGQNARFSRTEPCRSPTPTSPAPAWFAMPPSSKGRPPRDRPAAGPPQPVGFRVPGRLRACARPIPPTDAPGDRRGDPEVRGPAVWAPTPIRSTPTPAVGRRSRSISSASASTCVCALSMPPPENGWRGSSRTRRCGSSGPPRCWRGRAPGSATSTLSHRAIRCCAAR